MARSCGSRCGRVGRAHNFERFLMCRNRAGADVLERQHQESSMATAPQRTVLSEPHIATLLPRTLVGIDCRYTCETRSGIPDQWANFGPHIGKIPGQLNGMAYGVSHNGTPEGAFDYLCAVEGSGAAPLAEGFTSLRLEPLQVVVFRHRGRVHEITAT